MGELSEKGKLHDQAAKTYNQQAADFVFRANNFRCAPDEIDLHGLYDILRVLNAKREVRRGSGSGV